MVIEVLRHVKQASGILLILEDGWLVPIYFSPTNHWLMLMGTEIIKERVQDGQTGEFRDMAYTQCKIVGNGSFGVVFQTKLAPSGEDAAIKRVLQDKRFKVPQ